MARKKKKNSHVYWICMGIYAVILIAAATFGLTKVWKYAEEYEAAQPSGTMDQYVAELNDKLWGAGIADTIAAMPHEVQSDDEVAEYVKDMLKNGVTYTRKGSSDSGTVVTYTLKCNGSPFGTVSLIEDESYKDKVEFGMLPWKLYNEEFDFTGLYSSVEAVVPRTFSVWLNGVELGSEYIVEENIRYDVLKDYYDEFEGLPTKVRYRFDHCIGTLEPVIKDENGDDFVIDPDKDDSQFIKPCDESELARLSEFAAAFVDRYLTYTSGAVDPMYGYQRLMPYLKLGADLDTRMQEAMDGLSWAHTSSVRVDSTVLNNATAIGDGFYICDISADATTFVPGKGEVVDTSNMRVIVVDTNDDIRAISLELY